MCEKCRKYIRIENLEKMFFFLELHGEGLIEGGKWKKNISKKVASREQDMNDVSELERIKAGGGKY